MAGFTNLGWLDLSDTQINDISALSGLSYLWWLDLSGNQINDISALSGMTYLYVLCLTDNPLNLAAYTTHIPQIFANNPNIDFSYPVCEHALIISSTEGGTVIVPGEGFFPYDTNEAVVIEATSDGAMYPFMGWTGSAVNHGKVADPSAMRTTVLVDGVYTLEATFDYPWETVYFEDFEEGAGLEWSQRITNLTPIEERGFLGQFGNTIVTLTLNNLPPHTKIRLAFDLFIIRTWDGLGIETPPGIAGSMGRGPDIWTLIIDANTILNTTFDNSYIDPYPIWHRQSYPHTVYRGSALSVLAPNRCH